MQNMLLILVDVTMWS